MLFSEATAQNDAAVTQDTPVIFDQSVKPDLNQSDATIKTNRLSRRDNERVAVARFNGTLPGDDVSVSRSVLQPLAKLFIIILGIFVWLRTLQLCHREVERKESAASPWTAGIFWIGLTGILVGFLIPTWTIGIGLILAASILPFVLFKRWRNRQPTTVPVPPLRWVHLLRPPKLAYTGDHVSAIELSSGQSIGTANSRIVLIPKSRVSSPDSEQRSRGTQNSIGYKTVLALIDEAVAQRATDLHINKKDGLINIRQRVDGTLSSIGTLPEATGTSVINILKVMSDLSIADRRRSQDGSFRVEVNGRRLSLRVASQGTQTGEKLSIRILDPAKQFATFAALGMREETQQRLNSALHQSNGMVVIVGATGAGKSTTACAALQTLNGDEYNICSIEDPIEYQIPSVDQIEINSRAGQTFESALRSVLRQDVDVIFIGEIRDTETAKIACQAAMTGQLVVATMHANDALSGANRLAELGVTLHNTANALRAVLCQKLVRKLCVDCCEAYTPTADVLSKAGMVGFEGELFRSPQAEGNQCHSCNGKGYMRRTAVFELLEVDAVIRELILENAANSKIAAVAQKNGMATLAAEGRRLVQEGIISIDELDRGFDKP